MEDGPVVERLNPPRALRQALQDGYSTSGRLGVGLPGVKRLMDEFEISSTVGHGTVVVVKKWKQ